MDGQREEDQHRFVTGQRSRHQLEVNQIDKILVLVIRRDISNHTHQLINEIILMNSKSLQCKTEGMII